MNTKTFIESLHDTYPVRASLGLAAVALLLFGLVYSLFAAELGRVLFPHAATGSLIERDGVVVGSALIAQPFSADRYFQPRPSASNYDPMAMSGSNQARSNPDMRKRIEEARAAIAKREGVAAEEVPSDLVTQSGSGGDPHISPQAAHIQMARVAKARGLTEAQVAELVGRHTESPQFGLLGQTRVNVLKLNLALDALSSHGSAQ
jgi:K+-transporting ATPase ATPase C chain